MFYITGDKHGNFLKVQEFCLQMHTKRSDTLIVLGDAGINYYLDSRDEILKKRLSKLQITLFCIHGNHEERPYNIQAYEIKKFNGGKVYYQKEYPNILFAKDGEIYNFDGKSCIVLGGAYSVDKEYRILKGYAWFENEQPNAQIKRFAKKQLEKINWNIDIVLSHTAPFKYEPREWFLPMVDQTRVDKTTEKWLGEIESNLQYKKWYIGHFHGQKVIKKDDGDIIFMYNDFSVL